MTDYAEDWLVEKLWLDLDRQVSRQQVATTVAEIAEQFQDATVTTFVPIFIRRKALERLKETLARTGHMAASSAPVDDAECLAIDLLEEMAGTDTPLPGPDSI
jgi:hypothetical protein